MEPNDEKPFRHVRHAREETDVPAESKRKIPETDEIFGDGLRCF